MLNGVNGLPLGIEASETYENCVQQLLEGDQIVFYTDGITEAQNPAGEQFGVERMDDILKRCVPTAAPVLESLLTALDQVTAGHPADDDRTLLVASVM